MTIGKEQVKYLKYILFLYFLFASLNVEVQAQDVQRFAERHITGTARYVGMGGAMTAIGGDPSAVFDNPAGLGLYRHSELSISLDETIDYTKQFTKLDSHQRTRFAASQVSAVWTWGNPNRQRGMILNSFMLATNRLANFNRDLRVQGEGMGMLPSICALTDGLQEKYLQNLPWDNVEIGWLSILGYEGYLINPMKNDRWTPALDMKNGEILLSETGNIDQYSLSWAANISNQWYVGVSVNIPSLAYTKRTTFTETDQINIAELKSMYHVSGLGVSGSLGLIYRPIQWLRFGASFHTPTIMNLSMQTEGDLYTLVDGSKYEVITPSSGAVNMELISALRTSVSIASQISNLAMLALQYDFSHAKDMENIHTLHMGLEFQVCRNVFLNAGYVFESSFTLTDPTIGLAYNSIRTDMDYRYTPNSQFYSMGFGYRSHKFIAQVAFQYRVQTIHQYATEMQVEPVVVFGQTHRVVASLAWKL